MPKTSMILRSHSEEQTRRIGKKIGQTMRRGTICLTGELGAGKTTFVRGLAQGLGIKTRVQSPTFTFQRIHRGPRANLYHFDCYRLEKYDALLAQELLEASEKNDGILVVEWGEKMAGALPSNAHTITFEFEDDDKRRLTLSPHLSL